MKIIILIAIVLGSVSMGHAKDYGDFKGAVYVRNYDGDTITFNLPGYPDILGKEISVRVNGIDTPEIRGECALEKARAVLIKKYVESILSNAKQIDLLNMGRGKFFRIVADVHIDGMDLKTSMLRNRFAVAYDGGKKTHDWCETN